jgi:hypothetical protein
LIEGAANVAALILLLDDHEAEEATSGAKACAHGIDAGEHAVEDESHVVVFGELKDGEHAAAAASRALLIRTAEGGCPHMSVAGAEIHDLLSDGEDAGLAGDDEEAVRGIATEPA